MADAITPFVDAASTAATVLGPPGVDRRRQETESRVAEISSLLSALEEAAVVSAPRVTMGPAVAADLKAAPVPVASPKVLPVAPAAATTPAPTPAAAIYQPGPVETYVPEPVPPRASALPTDDHENRLVQVRLGLASSLFTALKTKHAPTASHCLRVALGCSTWALYKRLDDETRDAVELASLLHDLGKVSVPDAILNKTEPLSADEQAVLDGHWRAGVEILACCSSSQRVLDAVAYAGVQFNGVGSEELRVVGERLPLESRMLAIVDAFDSMTAALPGQQPHSREQALRQLSLGAGTVFDPVLVKQFIELLSHDQEALTAQIAGRWFNDLGKRQSELPWQVQPTFQAPPEPDTTVYGPSYFEQQLIDSMHDGVIFVDVHSQIFLWSKGAERLTGVSSAAASGRHFVPSLLDMCNTAGRRVRDETCPVARALQSGAQLRQRLEILGRQGGHVAIDLHAISGAHAGWRPSGRDGRATRRGARGVARGEVRGSARRGHQGPDD